MCGALKIHRQTLTDGDGAADIAFIVVNGSRTLDIDFDPRIPTMIMMVFWMGLTLTERG